MPINSGGTIWMAFLLTPYRKADPATDSFWPFAFLSEG
jgi:hypothetical protein